MISLGYNIRSDVQRISGLILVFDRVHFSSLSLIVLVGLARQLRLHLERTGCIVHRHDDLHELDLIRVREGRRVKEL